MARVALSAMALVFMNAGLTSASDFPRLDEAVPSNIDVKSIAPVFDFDSDGCFPAAGISRNGDKNGGLDVTGSVTGGCRSTNFLDQSNTVHRHACGTTGGTEYCGHFYAIYFEKDQLTEFGGGHRHDWEYAAVWTTNGTVTHGSYSAHGDLTTEPASNIGFEDGHLKIVYHKEGVGSHALRFSDAGEVAENPYGRFVTPTIISWYEMRGDQGWNSAVLRTLLGNYDFGGANLPVQNGRFYTNLNEFKPAEYPAFTYGHIGASNTGPALNYNTWVNRGTNLCIDLEGGALGNGANIHQLACTGATNQVWTFDSEYGVIRSLVDPRWCLDHGNTYATGDIVKLWFCHHGSEQQWSQRSDGSYRTTVNETFALDGLANTGDIVLWGYWGGENQKWSLN